MEEQKQYTIKERLIKNELEISDVFTISFALYKFNFYNFFIISLLCYLPLELLAMKFPLPVIELSLTEMPVITESFMKTLSLHFAANLVSLTIITSSVAITIESMIQKRYINAFSAIAFAIRRFIPVFITMLIYIIITSVGFICLIIPGIILSVFFLFSVYMASIRNAGVIFSFKSSLSLVRKNFVKIFIISSFVVAFQFAFNILIGSVMIKTTADIAYYIFSRIIFYLLMGYLQGVISVLFLNFDYNYNGRRFFRTV